MNEKTLIEADWSLNDEGDGVEAEGSVPICSLYTADDFPCHDESDEATITADRRDVANLIVAAPHLLSSLRSLLALRRPCQFGKGIDGGEYHLIYDPDTGGDSLGHKREDCIYCAARDALAKATGGQS